MVSSGIRELSENSPHFLSGVFVQHAEQKANDKRWVPLGIASRLLGVNESTMREWADRGVIRSFRTPGRHRRFSQDDITRLMEGRSREGQGNGVQQWSDTAVRKIRRRLHRPKAEVFPWQTKLDEEGTERLRLFGRRLLQLAMEYSSLRRPQPELLAEARLIGEGYGREVKRQEVPLEEGARAYTFFRNSFVDILSESWENQRHAPWELPDLWKQGSTILDEVLLAMIAAYQETAASPGQGAV